MKRHESGWAKVAELEEQMVRQNEQHLRLADMYARRKDQLCTENDVLRDELETLKKATERLSAKVARDCGEAGGIYEKENRDALKAYADILEGKDG